MEGVPGEYGNIPVPGEGADPKPHYEVHEGKLSIGDKTYRINVTKPGGEAVDLTPDQLEDIAKFVATILEKEGYDVTQHAATRIFTSGDQARIASAEENAPLDFDSKLLTDEDSIAAAKEIEKIALRALGMLPAGAGGDTTEATAPPPPPGTPPLPPGTPTQPNAGAATADGGGAIPADPDRPVDTGEPPAAVARPATLPGGLDPAAIVLNNLEIGLQAEDDIVVPTGTAAPPTVLVGDAVIELEKVDAVADAAGVDGAAPAAPAETGPVVLGNPPDTNTVGAAKLRFKKQVDRGRAFGDVLGRQYQSDDIISSLAPSKQAKYLKDVGDALGRLEDALDYAETVAKVNLYTEMFSSSTEEDDKVFRDSDPLPLKLVSREGNGAMHSLGKKNDKEVSKALAKAQKSLCIALAHALDKKGSNSNSIEEGKAKALQPALTVMQESISQWVRDYIPENQTDIDRKAAYLEGERAHYATGEMKATAPVKAGVIGFAPSRRPDGTLQTNVLVEPKIDGDAVHKQFKAFVPMSISHKQRVPIHKQIATKTKSGAGATYDSSLTPCNNHFDAMLPGNVDPTTGKGHFESLVGTDGGISAGDTGAEHAKNMVLSTCAREGKPLSSVIRMGIAGREEAQQQAEEMLAAAVIQELTAIGVSLDDIAAHQTDPHNGPLNITMVSSSIVSPDKREVIYHYGKPEKNEHRLWKQQMDALAALTDGDGPITVSVAGRDVQVKVNTIALNYGVNVGAAEGKNLKVKTIYWGLDTQFKDNKAGLATLKKEVDRFKATWESLIPMSPRNHDARVQLDTITRDIDALHQTIIQLNADKHAYREAGNQYEVPAKLLCLANLMDQSNRKLRQLAEEVGIEVDPLQLPPSMKAFLNCMSGKDRSGVLDAQVKALAILHDQLGFWPSHEELNGIVKPDGSNKEGFEGIQRHFVNVFLDVLLQGGGLEITELNTDAYGYKAGMEFMPFRTNDELWKDPEIQEKYRLAIGLGETTST